MNEWMNEWMNTRINQWINNKHPDMMKKNQNNPPNENETTEQWTHEWNGRWEWVRLCTHVSPFAAKCFSIWKFSICFQMDNWKTPWTPKQRTVKQELKQTDKNQQTTNTTDIIINRHVIHAKTNRAQLGREHHEYNHGMRRKHNRRNETHNDQLE